MSGDTAEGAEEILDLRTMGEEFARDPYPVLAALRARGPVQRVITLGGFEAWLVLGYEEARAALADPRLSKRWENASEEVRGQRVFGHHMLAADPPDHTRLRALVAREFTVRRTEALARRIQATTDQLLDAMLAAPDRRADLVEALAFPLPITVICELLGVPSADRGDLRGWTNGLPATVDHLVRFLVDLIRDKRESPGDDLLSALVASHDDEDELTSLAFLLLFAGYENSVNLIGNGVLALLRHPDQMSALRADPGLIEPAVEELLRYDAPAPVAIRRFPIEDIEIGGVTIPAGEPVLLGLASANHDPARVTDPDSLVLDRADQAHL
jgi:cytochrome P450